MQGPWQHDGAPGVTPAACVLPWRWHKCNRGGTAALTTSPRNTSAAPSQRIRTISRRLHRRQLNCGVAPPPAAPAARPWPAQQRSRRRLARIQPGTPIAGNVRQRWLSACARTSAERCLHACLSTEPSATSTPAQAVCVAARAPENGQQVAPQLLCTQCLEVDKGNALGRRLGAVLRCGFDIDTTWRRRRRRNRVRDCARRLCADAPLPSAPDADSLRRIQCGAGRAPLLSVLTASY